MVQLQTLDGPVRKTGDTREKLLAIAEDAVLAKGFAGTSIDELIAAAGLTKSGFFYHFKDKAELAKAMLLRYLEHDRKLLDDLFLRADELNEDPLHGFLVGLKMFAEMMGNMSEAHPGCLAASFVYQDQLFNREVRELNAEGILSWRRRFRVRFDRIAHKYPPRADVDLDALSDMAATMIEGALILSRALRDPKIPAQQIMLYRDYVRCVFLKD
jgi:TetR/AcrR family transcriptional regulator, transcriptional repressor for nem operon